MLQLNQSSNKYPSFCFFFLQVRSQQEITTSYRKPLKGMMSSDFRVKSCSEFYSLEQVLCQNPKCFVVKAAFQSKKQLFKVRKNHGPSFIMRLLQGTALFLWLRMLWLKMQKSNKRFCFLLYRCMSQLLVQFFKAFSIVQ